MAAKIKKAEKKTLKKKAAKKVVKKAVKKAAAKQILKPTKKLFALEIALLDKLQLELFEAISQKPQTMNFDEIRLFVDNVYMVLNKCATITKDIKNSLLQKDYKELFTETYNSPA
ncbi:MAG: hypothetical protein WC644_12885 [Ignavibacteria bacterium]